MSDEKDFLHDLAGPISTAIFITDAMFEASVNWPESMKNEVSQLRNVIKSLLETEKLMASRREKLLKQGECK